jgi:hypothetical protein
MWINEQTKGVFILHTDIRYECWKDGKELPAILDDAILAENGYAVVTQVPVPYDRVTQKLVAQAPVKGDTGWTQGFDVAELEAAEIANNRNIIEVQRVSRIRQEVQEGDLKAMRSFFDGDTAAVEAWKIKAAELLAQI